MKIIIAPDSFKESLTSSQAAVSIEHGIRRVFPQAACVKIPMADGGEGTVEALVTATGGKYVTVRVRGPLGTPVRARYGVLGDQRTAVIEMAAASGLELVPPSKRNPLITTTFGTGELIRHALDHGLTKFVIGIGGSATVDGGAGVGQALGVKYEVRSAKCEVRTKEKGNRLREQSLSSLQSAVRSPQSAIEYSAGRIFMSGGLLDRVIGIDMTSLHSGVKNATFVVACDVTNPLIGPKGAAPVYGPQKGATPEIVKILSRNLMHFARLVDRDLGIDIRYLPGAGAAGGLGGALVAFLGAELKPGIDIVIDAADLARQIKGADLVMTGEGKIDEQTPFGKTPIGVARVARKMRVPVVAIGGSLGDGAMRIFSHGIDGLEACVARPMDVGTALKDGAHNLEMAAERVMRLIAIGQKLKP
jgi:glycerate kinase